MWYIYNDEEFEVEFFMTRGLRLYIFGEAKFNML